MQINSREFAIKRPSSPDSKVLRGLGDLVILPKDILEQIWNKLDLPEKMKFARASKWIRIEFLLNGPLLLKTLFKIDSIVFPKNKEIVPTPYLHILAKDVPGPYNFLRFSHQVIDSSSFTGEVPKSKYSVMFPFVCSLFRKDRLNRYIIIKGEDKKSIEIPFRIKDEPLGPQSFVYTELPGDGKLLLVGSKVCHAPNADLKDLYTFTIYLISFDFEMQAGECQEITRIVLPLKIANDSDVVQIIPLGQDHNAILNLGGHIHSLIGNHLWHVLGPKINGNITFCRGFSQDPKSGRWLGLFGKGLSTPSKNFVKEFSFPKATFFELNSLSNSFGWGLIEKITGKIKAVFDESKF